MTWWQRLWRRNKLEEQLEKELRFHLDQHAADLIAQGRDPQEARRQARLALGGPEQVKEDCRDARGTRWLEDLWQDARYALRTFRQRPGFMAVTLCTLALGTGAATVMFTVINGVLLKPVPYPEPERLVTLQGRTDPRYGDQYLAYLDFLDSQRESQSLASMAAWVYDGGTVSEPGEAAYAELRHVSSGLFSVLGVTVFQGRTFLPEEDRPGAAPVAIVSYGFWQRRFGGNLAALGMPVVIDHKRFTIVGIAPARFRLGDDDDIYLPLGQNTASYLRNRRARPVRVLARLRPGVTLVQAQAELALIGTHLAAQYPDTNADRAFVVRQLRPEVGNVGSTLWLLLGAVSLVLLIACVNVASLLLARSVSRERELAVRAALGAGRGRLVRQCLTESALLGLAGGALGVLLAAAGIRPFVTFWPGSLPRAEEVGLDWRVLLFALTVSLACGLLFGLAPALRAPARELEQTLRAGTRSLAGSSRRLHSGFVVSEIALAVVLLVSAGMLGRTLLHQSSLDPGLNIRNVVTARMALSPATLTNPALTRAAWEDVQDRARRVPGVQSVAIVDTVPMREGNNPLGYWITADVPPENKQPVALATSVTPDYLKVMEIPLRQGRFFDDHDRIGSELVVVIDDVLARQAFGREEPVGKRLWVPGIAPGPLKVIGVAGHVRYWGLAGDDQAQVRAQFYYPFAQVPDPLVRRWSELMSIAIRTGVAPLSVVQPVGREVRGAAGDQVLYEVHTMEQLASATLARQSFLLLLFAIFAGLALLLACIGIYGVLAYLTNQRVPEMGVRIALGSSPGEVMWLVLRQSLGVIFLGVGVGTAGALAAGRVLKLLVEGMQPTEPITFAGMIAVLVAAALLASFIPARRASRVDPLSALRQE
jgi:predicted permease